MTSLKNLIRDVVKPPKAGIRKHRKATKPIRRLIVLKNRAVYRRCLLHCRKLGIRPVKKIHTLHAILLHTHPQADMSKLQKHVMVKRIEADRKMKLHVVKKKASLSATSCASIRTKEIIPWGIQRIQAPNVWSRTQGRGIRVAVLDTGIAKHPDLRISGSFNAISSSPVRDLNGHGTHVAGTITALRNSFGVVGAAPKVKLFAVKAFNAQGTAFTSDIIQGIDWCIRHRMKVINMSFGMSDFSASLRDIIRRAYRRGIVMVASCGNNGVFSGQIDFPARFPETIAVAASTEVNSIADFSSRGAGIDVAAPGTSICSTFPGKRYRRMDGTSMAAPHVTGTAALLLCLHPQASPLAVRRRLQRTATKLTGFSVLSQGSGLINAARAIR